MSAHALEYAKWIFEWLLLIPVVCGSIYAVLCLFTAVRFRQLTAQPSLQEAVSWPLVTVLKPICGLEKNLKENLRSTCLQDYPEFQVVFSVQETDDPAIPLLKQIQREFGEGRVTVAVESCRPGTNGKINNMMGGLRHARHDLLVISDSDVRLKPDYLKTIVAPLRDPNVGCACTLYKAACAGSWFEKLEQLTLNADFIPNVIFAHISGITKFCLGASTALRRSTLAEIGGLEGLADYLVEDFEMGRRILAAGKKIQIVPYLVDTIVDLKSPAQWWGHLVYWDQNNRAARPWAYFATILIRAVPCALIYALARLGNPVGLAVLAGSLFLRMTTAAAILKWGLGDREGLKNIAWLPLRDVVSLVSWFLAYVKRTTIWRGSEFILTADGRLVTREIRS